VIAMGIIFLLKIGDPKLVTLTVIFRLVVGLVFGIGIATLFGFEGITFIVVCLCSAGPLTFTPCLTLSWQDWIPGSVRAPHRSPSWRA